MTKDDIKFVTKIYTDEFQKEQSLKSAFAQNIYDNGKSKYFEALKSYNSKYSKDLRKNNNIKNKSIKPYFDEPVEFPLDNRML
jgi:hypothetical protein